MGIVHSNLLPGSLRGRTARLAALDRGQGTAPDDEGPDGVAGFDPAGHNVENVISYARAHPDEAAAILKLEKGKDGKKRKGVLDALS